MILIRLFAFILFHVFTFISATVSSNTNPAQLITLDKDQFTEVLKQVTFDYLKSELNITADKILTDLFQNQFYHQKCLLILRIFWETMQMSWVR